MSCDPSIASLKCNGASICAEVISRKGVNYSFLEKILYCSSVSLSRDSGCRLDLYSALTWDKKGMDSGRNHSHSQTYFLSSHVIQAPFHSADFKCIYLFIFKILIIVITIFHDMVYYYYFFYDTFP